MSRTQIQLRPTDDGRRMSLDDFEFAEGTAGKIYELHNGVVSVVDVPGWAHAAQVHELRKQIAQFDFAHPGRIAAVLGGADCKILLQALQSERHPDLAIYTSMPDDPSDWASAVPEIIIEVLSPSSRQRDYEEKPEEYLQFGVKEYWIADRPEEVLFVHRRVAGRWATTAVKPPDMYDCKSMRGLSIDIAKVFAAADRFD